MSETPVAHSSLVGGSTASRRLNCPGSYLREQKAPRGGSSSYAQEGTALHEVIALVLDKGYEPSDLLPFHYRQEPKVNEAGEVTEEAWELTVEPGLWEDLGQPALDMFDAFLNEIEDDQEGQAATYMVEESGEFPGIEGAFGTSDVPFRCGEIGGIWDWKFGRGPVSAEENEQLMFYFAAIRAKYPAFFEGTTRVMLCISQPQVNDQEPSTWETTHEDIDAFILDLQDAVEEAKKPDAHIEKGAWCKFADCKAVCELHIGAAARLGEMLNSLEAHQEDQMSPTPTEGPLCMDTFLSEAMELAEMAESWAKHIAGITQERLEEGLPVDGWKLVAKKSSGRVWTADDAKIVSRLRSRGLKADDYYKKTVVTPPQAEKLLKKLGKELPDDIVEAKPSSGFTLTRDGDPRPEKATATGTARALGERLQAMVAKSE